MIRLQYIVFFFYDIAKNVEDFFFRRDKEC